MVSINNIPWHQGFDLDKFEHLLVGLCGYVGADLVVPVHPRYFDNDLIKTFELYVLDLYQYNNY